MNPRYLRAVASDTFSALPRAARWALAEIATLAHRTNGILELSVGDDAATPFDGLIASPIDAVPLLADGPCGTICEVAYVASRTILVIDRACWETLQAPASRSTATDASGGRGRGRPVQDESPKAQAKRERQRRYTERKRAEHADAPPESGRRTVARATPEASEIAPSTPVVTASEVERHNSPTVERHNSSEVAHKPPSDVTPAPVATKPKRDDFSVITENLRKIVEKRQRQKSEKESVINSVIIPLSTSVINQNSLPSDSLAHAPISDLRSLGSVSSDLNLNSEIPIRTENSRQQDKTNARASQFDNGNYDADETADAALECDRDKFVRCLEQSGFHKPNAGETIEEFSAKLIAKAVSEGADPMQALSDMVLALRYEKVTARTNGLLFKKFKDAIEKQKARASKGVEYPAEAMEKRSVRPIGRYAPQSANDCLEEVLQAVGGAR